MGAGLLLADGEELMHLLRLNDVAPLRSLFIPGLPTKKARQEQVSVNMIPLIKTDSSFFSQVQQPRRGVLSSSSFSYSNVGNDIGHVTSLSMPQFSHLYNNVSDQMISMVPSNSGILYVWLEPPEEQILIWYSFIFFRPLNSKRKQSHI